MTQEKACCGQEPQEELIQTDIVENPEETRIQWYINKEENAANRFNICHDCDQLVPVVSMCKQCGCFMKIKTRIYDSSCPLQKW
jgi:hypothetical protein